MFIYTNIGLMHAIVLLSHIFLDFRRLQFDELPQRCSDAQGDNYTEWRKKVDLAFVSAEVEWVVDTPQPVKPIEQGRDVKDDDAAWEKKKDYAPVELAYVLENQKWVNANKKCMAFIKNTIENAIVGSIEECTSVGEFLETIKS
jgi:hypothetical protein